VNSYHVQLVADVRVTESKSIPGSTTAAAQADEVALIVNSGANVRQQR
jgi:hypothetical protein